MSDEDIIKLYNKGYSVHYITDEYYRLANKNNKPITLNGVMLFPAKIYNKSYCKTQVLSVIYNHLIKNYSAHTQTST